MKAKKKPAGKRVASNDGLGGFKDLPMKAWAVFNKRRRLVIFGQKHSRFFVFPSEDEAKDFSLFGDGDTIVRVRILIDKI